MATIEELKELTKQMNDRQEAHYWDNEWLEQICSFWQEQTNIRFRLLDFEYYNEDQLKIITEEKIAFVREQNFEGAANKWEIEKKFIKEPVGLYPLKPLRIEYFNLFSGRFE